ncbi:GNAT family N-acetyltransferase [Sporosarcina oncorhynchi]|uniref:GNAT family N-acetyltransferase n=1 Tax=Sporosarcina oncorhynchi TaxID=3056444 RepID=A0ABZ0L3N3_9BACL|nr:GNAT family N-acetyltransferase [Sporosarcina sp. T2O-4]WOV86780.1 GNAT family N-acetyltransferase [Sporosarcina sp. T2O-4]
MHLERPSLKWQDEHLDYIEEWDGRKLQPRNFRFDTDNSYDQYLKELIVEEAGSDDRVPTSNYFLIDNNRILGMVTIRHVLNDYLLQVDGHIGYSIRPTERRKGYATQLLAETLKITDQLGIVEVLVTCNADNIGSAKVILNNGGIEDEHFVEAHGNIVRRFWIRS